MTDDQCLGGGVSFLFHPIRTTPTIVARHPYTKQSTNEYRTNTKKFAERNFSLPARRAVWSSVIHVSNALVRGCFSRDAERHRSRCGSNETR